LSPLLLRRFGGFADGLTLSVPTDPALDEGLKTCIRELQGAMP